MQYALLETNLTKRMVRTILDHLILELLVEEPIHGYRLIRKIRQKHGVYFSPSTIYPLLSKLEAKGLVKGEWEIPKVGRGFSKRNGKPRKVYSITHEGIVVLREQKGDIKLLLPRLSIGILERAEAVIG